MLELLKESISFYQIPGYIGMLFAIISFQCKKNKLYFLFQTLCALSFSVQFAITQKFSGLFMNIFSIIRGAIFLGGEKFHKKAYLFAIEGLFVSSFFISIFWLKENALFALLPLIAQLFGTAVMWTRNGKAIRVAQLGVISPAWLIYNVINVSIGGILCETFNICSVIVSFIRFKKINYDKN